MPNMTVDYQRVCHSLRKMRAELRRVFPHREQNKGFVTGYKSRWNYSGHNASNLGIVFAYDIGVDIEGDGTGLLPGDAERLANYLRTECNARFQYLIYDGRIAGNHTNWQWVPYTGASPHKDHIHISVLDLYWGDPVSVPASVYDSTAPWGIVKHFTGIQPSAGGVTPIRKDLDMDKEELIEILDSYWKNSIPVPGNIGSAGWRKKNPKWWLPTAISKIWAVVSSAARDARATRRLLEEVAERSGMTKAEVRQTVYTATTDALEDGTVDVDIKINDKETP